MEKKIELAKVLMRDGWFSETYFKGVMHSTHRIDLPFFRDIKDLCEVRVIKVDECMLEPDSNCENYRNYKCESCPYQVFVEKKNIISLIVPLRKSVKSKFKS